MKLNWKKMFDWTVVDVQQPVPRQDKTGAITGYDVVVQYLHHGTRKLSFDVNHEALYAQYGSPLKAAQKIYEEYHKRALQWQTRAARQFAK